MSKFDWSLAPDDAKIYSPAYGEIKACWYKEEGGKIYCWIDGDSSWSAREYMIGDLIYRPEPQPKPWSGPEDGLPPVGTMCEYLEDGNGDWEEVTIVAIDHRLDYQFAVFHGDKGYSGDRRTEMFRAIPAPDQKRETAIREFMDVVGIDCRVTASKAVDAGFKREVV